MSDRLKSILIISGITIFMVVFFVLVFFVFPSMNKEKTSQKNTATVSKKLFNIPGGSYYGEGFIVSQGVMEDNKTTIFNIFVNDNPFSDKANKALVWLKSQGVSLNSINYTCGPAMRIQATQEEIKKCTHIIKNDK